MKTAMKKIFSLMLVAVLLIGVMPFQAFAEETNPAGPDARGYLIPCPKCNQLGHYSWDHCDVCDKVDCICCDECGKADCICCDECGKADCICCDECGKADCICCDECGKADCICCDECGKADCICNDGIGDMNLPGNFGPAIPNTPAAGGNEDDDRPSGGQQKKVVTVNFVIGNNIAETATWNNAATVQKLIDECCTVDDSAPLHYSGARVENTPYELEDVVALGKTVHIYLYTETENEDPVEACKKCGVAPCICDNCKTCGAPEGTHTEDCPKHPEYNKREMTNITLNYNYKGSPRNGSFEAKKGDLLKDVIASIPAPTRDGHLFSHWTLDAEGYDSIKTEHVTNGMTIFAQWDDDLAIGGKYTIRVNLNYDHKMGEPLTNIKRGTKMGDILDYVTEPTRWNHKFMGWYWDRECKDAVKDSDKIYKNDEIFAKWEYRKNTNDIMLKIYLNGETKSAAKIVDLYDYAKDGRITKDEVDKIVKKYYKAKSSSDDMDIDGLFTVDTWHNGKYSMRNAEKSIRVENRDETIIYVMVRDAKAITSSSADTTNPKTGDMIMTSVIVMGASVSALAVLFYLNKKRAY